MTVEGSCKSGTCEELMVFHLLNLQKSWTMYSTRHLRLLQSLVIRPLLSGALLVSDLLGLSTA